MRRVAVRGRLARPFEGVSLCSQLDGIRRALVRIGLEKQNELLGGGKRCNELTPTVPRRQIRGRDQD